jgi:hypothetical protein
MGKPRHPLTAESLGLGVYRITADGKAAAGRDHPQLRSRYLTDLLDLLETCGGGVAERDLRQFMPPESLGTSLVILLELGLIKRC